MRKQVHGWTSIYAYRLTESYELSNGYTAPAGSYVENNSNLRIIGDDTEEVTEPEKPGEQENILDKPWYEIPLQTYSGDGITEDDYDILYQKLMDVDINSLSPELKEYYEQCSGNLRILLGDSWDTEDAEKVEDLYDKAQNDPVYTNPLLVGSNNDNAKNVTPDDIISDGDKFMEAGQNSNIGTINQNSADTVFDSIFNILLAIGITVAVIWGLIIAIKLMLSSVEEKAEYKKILWPYLVGCIVIFGAFGIWKLVILIMNNTL